MNSVAMPKVELSARTVALEIWDRLAGFLPPVYSPHGGTCPPCIIDAANAIMEMESASQAAEIERLTRERQNFKSQAEIMTGAASSFEARAETLSRLLAEATGALEPFAEAAGALDDNHRDGSPIWETAAAMGIDAVHLRTAAITLSNIRGHNG